MKILHFADLHLGVETYGRVDPATGLSTRFLDFLAALDKVVEYAQKNAIDLVVFCGDAYKTREPTQTQQREFARRISRLSSSNIPIFLLIGNHDLPNAISRATTTEIFDTLAVQNVYVAGKPDALRIPTRSGIVQVAALPWLRRSTLLAREEIKGLDIDKINQKLQEILTGVVSSLAERIDPNLPAILAAHVWISGARVGSENNMTMGATENGLLLSAVANPAFDYVALGHVHKHQVLKTSPPVVYSGSLERVDFGEEADDKGFCVVEIESDAVTAKKRVSYKFHPLDGRRFLKVEVTLEPGDVDPTGTLLQAIAAHKDEVKDAVVRLNISMPSELQGKIRENDIKEALKEAYYPTVAREIRREVRLRLGKYTAGELSPQEALKAYLEAKRYSPEQTKRLLEYGEKLIAESIET